MRVEYYVGMSLEREEGHGMVCEVCLLRAVE